MKSLVINDVVGYLESERWLSRFDGAALAAGKRLVAARQVSGVLAELLETGDAELKAVVTEKDGRSFHPAVVLWRESGGLTLEGECGCDAGTNCAHSAALLFYLGKGNGARLARAFGGTPLAEKMTGGKTLEILPEPLSEPSNRVISETEPSFLLRVQHRREGERSAWLPEVFAEAFAVYAGNRVPLSPAGQLPPIVLPEGKIKRARAAETTALNTLYSLDLQPGAEEPPQSLRKLDRPETEGTLWAPDTKKWPHPEFYWQRFRHEGVPALERRGWEVRFTADVGFKPLVFRTDTWQAEIVDEGKGWFHLSAGFEIDGETFELQPILAALVKNRFLDVTEGMPSGQEFMIFLPDGRGLALPVGRFRRILKTLGELLEFKFGNGPVKLGKLDAALVAGELAGESLSLTVPQEVEELSARLRDFESIERVPLPTGLRAELREYQYDGYCWMQFLARHGLNGILADDMGLGKTLQTLTHLLSGIESGRSEGLPSLVIAPTSVVMNWQREAAKFAPDLSVLVLQGADRKSQFRKISRSDLVLTSYALLHRDLDHLLEHEFHLLALDEAQHIKNPGAQVTQAVGSLRAKHRLCLSGTPVENHLGELWSLFHFLMPGLLGSLDTFRSVYQTPIEKSGSEAKRAALVRRVGPLILRRTKHDVAKELPSKTEILHEIEMSQAQKDLYETVRSTMDKQVRQALAIRGQQAQIVFLDALLKLRQICCHPGLLKEQRSAATSAKFDYLVDLLRVFREEGHRVLLFSQFTSMLDLIEAHLVGEKVVYLKLTGETKDRQGLVERFQGGEGEVFLISLKAGGTGLTLTGADTVIHYDPWWNPAAENQATDRAYRIGQDKPVFVHKLICQNTVEERIQQMQGKKDDLATDLLSGATTGLNLTPETLAGLLGDFG
ncbi:MAG TPA: DEAD/DEAH box helicase [Verrucomicrobiales bacterium]|nr:DEAD/DEAH box helicase [Verrucomicrobiales bacterium]